MKTIPMFGRMAVGRSSGWGNGADGQPCEEAAWTPYVRVDRRTVDDPDKIFSLGKQQWLAEGCNHRVEEGQICRDFFDHRWTVNIYDSEMLRAFCMKYKPIILDVDTSGLEPCFSIEIYDGDME